MAIDVGSAAIDRGDAIGGERTLVDKNNPANATGTINHIEIYMPIGGTTIDVASFFVVSGNNLSTRGSTGVLSIVDAGLTTFDAPGDFTAFDINEGDYIGVYIVGSGYYIEQDLFGVGVWRISGDYVPCTNETFTFNADQTMSLYATGTTVGGYTLEIGSGSFAETGQTVNLLRDGKLGISAGSFAETGQTVALLKGFALDIGSGSFIETGQTASLLKGFCISIGAGTYTWTGFTVTLTKSGAEYIITILAGTFALTGSSVTLLQKDGDYTIPRPVETAYEELIKTPTSYSELSKTTTDYTELTKPTTSHTELTKPTTEYEEE